MNGKAYIVENTKLSEWADKRMKSIAALTHTTIFNLLQLACDTFIRYMSKDTNINPAMERAMNLFEDPKEWKDQFNLCDCGDFQVEEAVYFIGNEKKKGLRAVMIKRPFFGVWTQTVNVQDIFEAVICKMFPGRYKKLRLLANEWDCQSQLDVLDRLLDNELQGVDSETIRKEFEDCNRDDYGRRPTDHRYKRKLHQDIERVKSIATTQTTIHFLPDDVPPLPEIDEHGEPIKVHDDTPPVNPHGMVW